jgi:hypothetical protein
MRSPDTIKRSLRVSSALYYAAKMPPLQRENKSKETNKQAVGSFPTCSPVRRVVHTLLKNVVLRIKKFIYRL